MPPSSPEGPQWFFLNCITKAGCGTHLTSCLGLIREHKGAVLLLALSSYPIRLHTPERSQSSSSSLVRKGPYKHRKKHMETIKEKILNEKKIENPKRKKKKPNIEHKMTPLTVLSF